MMRALVLFFLACCLTACSQKQDLQLHYVQSLPAVPKGAPVLIMLHGYGSNEKDLFSMRSAFPAEFAVFSFRGPLQTPSGGNCWYPLEFLPEKKFRHDYQAAAKSREMILQSVSALCKKHGLDSGRVFIMGFSQGGTMCYDLAFHSPSRIKGVLALSGRLMPESAAAVKQKNSALPHFFIAHGISDQVIDFTDGQEAWKLLKERKTGSLEFKSYPIAHSISQDEISDIRAWLKERSR